ncbi:MAG: hypothetical protein Q9223_002987 [Gallowayella weberi]
MFKCPQQGCTRSFRQKKNLTFHFNFSHRSKQNGNHAASAPISSLVANPHRTETASRDITGSLDNLSLANESNLDYLSGLAVLKLRDLGDDESDVSSYQPSILDLGNESSLEVRPTYQLRNRTIGQQQSLDTQDSQDPMNVDKKEVEASSERKRPVSLTFHPEPLSMCGVIESQAIPGQQIAIAWLTVAARNVFIDRLRLLVQCWGGVMLSHQGTCVLCPEAFGSWTLSSMIDAHPDVSNPFDLPTPQDPQLQYQYADYTTTFIQAAAWFLGGTWPRTEEGPTKRNRETCAQRARLARYKGHDVPGECSLHDPPCLLQHAALTSAEVYLIQFDIVRQATDHHLKLSRDQPAKVPHPFPTYESHLPLAWKLSQPIVDVDPTNFVAGSPKPTGRGRLDLICCFCENLGFASPTGLWSHLIKQHDEISRSQRLSYIKKTAIQWDHYWAGCEQSCRGSATLEKIAQAKKNGFSWVDVQAW